MRNQSKVLLIILVLTTLSYCDKYGGDSEEIDDDRITTLLEVDDDNITTSSTEDQVTTVPYQTTTNAGNETSKQKEFFDEEGKNKSYAIKDLSEEDLGKQEQTTETKITTFIPKKLSKVTTRTWEREPTEFNKTANKHRDHIKESCPKFKYGGDFDFNDMADVWQVIYYHTKEKVQCFKIYIKVLSSNEKNSLRKRFGSFNGKVNWNECKLEIKSSAHMQRSHYLQGDNEDDGVMDNVLIVETSSDEKGDTGTKPTLRDEAPDQWLVVRNFLLMRDCETGSIVVFSRVPHQPRLDDILDALKQFGTEDMNGKLACLDEEIIKPYDTEDDGSANFD